MCSLFQECTTSTKEDKKILWTLGPAYMILHDCPSVIPVYKSPGQCHPVQYFHSGLSLPHCLAFRLRELPPFLHFLDAVVAFGGLLTFLYSGRPLAWMGDIPRVWIRRSINRLGNPFFRILYFYQTFQLYCDVFTFKRNSCIDASYEKDAIIND